METNLDWNYINRIIHKFVNSFFEKIGDKKLICYGASSLWPDVTQIIDIQERVEFFVDRDQNKWGQEYYGKVIQSPEVLRNVDKTEYAVAVISFAFAEISKILDDMGWEKDINYFDTYLYTYPRMEIKACEIINQYLKFLDTVPAEIRDVKVREESERIGIILNAEGLNYSATVYIPYMASLFLILKWKGYRVKLIVDRLRWEGDIELYEGRCDIRAHTRDVVIRRMREFIPEEDILYIDAIERTQLNRLSDSCRVGRDLHFDN